MTVSNSTKSKLSKEFNKLYLVTGPNEYSRVWKKASLVHYCKKLYGVNLKEFLGKYRGIYGDFKIVQYKPKSIY